MRGLCERKEAGGFPRPSRQPLDYVASDVYYSTDNKLWAWWNLFQEWSILSQSISYSLKVLAKHSQANDRKDQIILEKNVSAMYVLVLKSNPKAAKLPNQTEIFRSGPTYLGILYSKTLY